MPVKRGTELDREYFNTSTIVQLLKYETLGITEQAEPWQHTG